MSRQHRTAEPPMPIPAEHPLRQSLNNEIHARPPVPLNVPERVSYLAFTHGTRTRDEELTHLGALAGMFGARFPESVGAHLLLTLGDLRLKYERHTEFTSYTFFSPIPTDTPLDLADARTSPLLALPAQWRQEIPGELLVATHIDVLPATALSPDAVIARYTETGNVFIASRFSDEAGWVFSDFRLHTGFSRFVVIDIALGERQAGRAIQRLLEIETYRMMALLTLPLAREVNQQLTASEQRLDALMAGMARDRPEDESTVLAELTQLAAEVEHSVAATAFRFSAAAAYFQLVEARVADLRESRVAGYPTIRGFMERRLTPAMTTCAAAARRQQELSARIARASQLLRTRVDIALERQNQEVLGQMNQRAKLQLRLQETVEGLSVVAITYYGSQLVQYLAKAAKAAGQPVSPDLATGLSIPLIAGVVALGLRRMRRRLAREEAAAGGG